MKKLILLCLFGLILNNVSGQIFYDDTATVLLRDTVYWGDDLFGKTDRSGRAWGVGYDVDEVARLCSDAKLNLGGELKISSSLSLSAPYNDATLPYTIVLTDTSLQDDGSQKVIKQWFINKSPFVDISFIFDQGTCPDTCEVTIYICQPSR